MAQPPIPDDDYDPCAFYVELRDARKRVLLGETVRSTRFRNGEEEREVEFTSANLAALDQALSTAKAECELSLNPTGRPRRSAIGIGFRGPILNGKIY